MPSYVIDPDQLNIAFEKAKISPHLGDIKLLWTMYINQDNGSPDLENFLIYNALRGRNIYHGMIGKCGEKYFHQKLTHVSYGGSTGKTIPHPWTNMYFNLLNMHRDMLNMVRPLMPIEMSLVSHEDLKTKYNKWFEPFKYRCSGGDWENRKASHLWRGFGTGNKPLLTMLIEEFGKAEQELRRIICVEHEH